jgi:hypothetical protein
MHDFHRSGIAPAGLRSYLAQEHWLYVATFADGASKVGTASSVRKWARLAEQGAVAAHYVARAQDGRVVRVLEDAVTAGAGLPQQVRSRAKAAALLAPLPGSRLRTINAALADGVRTLLAGSSQDGFEPVREEWVPPATGDLLLTGSPRHAYPHALDGGTHGLSVRSVLGGFALVRTDGTKLDFVVDLGALKGKRIRFGDFSSAPSPVQDQLF